MIINGIQKLTLLDYPGLVSCVLFFSGCNFRCPFCHNAALVLNESAEYKDMTDNIDESEIMSFLIKRRGVLDGVVISGGEPLLRSGITEFAGRIKALGYKVKLDTNGSMPAALRGIIDAGVIDYVAMDIKNSRDKYASTSGMNADMNLNNIEESIKLLLENEKVDYEFRTTIVDELHTADDIEQTAKWLTGARRYYLQQFSPGNGTIKKGFSSPSEEKMQSYLMLARKYIKNTELRGVKAES